MVKARRQFLKFTCKIFTKIKIVKNYIRYKNAKHNHVYGKNVIFLEAFNIPGRRIIQLIHHFLFSGYNCYLDYSFRQYLKLDENAIYASKLKGIFPAKKKTTGFSIIVSDNKEALDSSDPNVLKVHINYLLLKNKFNNIDTVTENDLYYPIGLHKNFLDFSIESEVLKAAFNSERKIGAIFAGNTISNSNPGKSAYNRSITKELLNINTRVEMFSHIAEKIQAEYIYFPDNLGVFLNDMESGYLKNKIVLINTQKFSIPRDKYFNILLNANFYIHMCGSKQPFCHNQIESMLAGCIPITQFKQFFVPGFEHKLNSLLFDTLDELGFLLLGVASGEYDDLLNSMRKNIICYYKKHHSFESFKNKLSYLMDNKINHTSHFIVK